MSSPQTAPAPALVEGQWVQDLRTGTTRVGHVTVFHAGKFTAWAQVLWDDANRPRLEVVHDIAVLNPVRGPVGQTQQLYFASPDCPYDDTTLVDDGDGWTCTVCYARWNGSGDAGTRACLECQGAQWAAVIDVDGRPLCATCARPATFRSAEATTDE